MSRQTLGRSQLRGPYQWRELRFHCQYQLLNPSLRRGSRQRSHHDLDGQRWRWDWSSLVAPDLAYLHVPPQLRTQVMGRHRLFPFPLGLISVLSKRQSPSLPLQAAPQQRFQLLHRVRLVSTVAIFLAQTIMLLDTPDRTCHPTQMWAGLRCSLPGHLDHIPTKREQSSPGYITISPTMQLRSSPTT